MDDRIEKGRQIAASGQLRQAADGTWIVLSQSKAKTKYRVNPKKGTCGCLDYLTWELQCKHLYAVKLHLAKDTNYESNTVMRPTYPRDWPAYNAGAVLAEERFEVFLTDLCSGIKEPQQRRGRPRISTRDMAQAIIMKVHSMQSGRRAQTAIRRCRDQGHIKRAPKYNTVSKYMRSPKLSPVLMRLVEESAAPLALIETHLAADATCFSAVQYSRWAKEKPYGKKQSAKERERQRRRQWVKAHALCGVKSGVVVSVIVTPGSVADVTMLPELLTRGSKRYRLVEEVSADRAYLSNLNLYAIAGLNAVPYIPFRSNSRPDGPTATPLWRKMFAKFYGDPSWAETYNLRQNVEASFSSCKRLLNGYVKSKSMVGATNEVLAKFVIVNILTVIRVCHELGIDPMFGTGSEHDGGGQDPTIH